MSLITKLLKEKADLERKEETAQNDFNHDMMTETSMFTLISVRIRLAELDKIIEWYAEEQKARRKA